MRATGIATGSSTAFAVGSFKVDAAISRATEMQTLIRERRVQRLHDLGARVVAEFIADLVRRHPDLAAEIDARLARFAELNPNILRVTGGDRFAPRPVRVVAGSDIRTAEHS